MLKVLFGFSRFEAVLAAHRCPAHYHLTQTNTPLFTMFVAADSLNNAGTMEVRECLHVFFCICAQVFISSRRVPVCEPPGLKRKEKKRAHRWKKK